MNGWEMMLALFEIYPGRPMGAMCSDLISVLDADPRLCGGVMIYGFTA